MKQLIKTIPALLLLAGLTTEVQAQQSDNATITANAEVVAAVEVSADQDLTFGNVTPGNAKTVDAEGNVAQGTTTGGEQNGQFTVTKGTDTEVLLEFTLPASLESDTETLPISFTTFGGTEMGLLSFTALTDLNFNPDETLLISNAAGTEEYFSAGEFNVSIGGTVEPAANQAAGSYTGDIVLTATYN